MGRRKQTANGRKHMTGEKDKGQRKVVQAFKPQAVVGQVSEAKECVRKVKERNMGDLFENMEKMDIQEERRKTIQARLEAEEAQKQAKEAKSRAEEAESRLEEAYDQIKETRSEAMRSIVQLCQRFGESREAAAQELMDTYAMDQKTAQETVMMYWKDGGKETAE